MPSEAKRKLDRHDELKSLRRQEEGAWSDIARIIRPDDADFGNSGNTHPPDAADVFDSTPLYAHDDFVGGLFGESVNPAERWLEFTLPDKDLAKWGPVQAWLWGEASRIYASLSPSVSGFYAEATAWFADTGAFGNGFLYQEEWEGRQRLIDQAMPLSQCYIDVDADGTLNTFSREFFLSGAQKASRFGERAGQADEKKRYRIVHLTEPAPDYVAGRLGPQGKRFSSVYCSPDDPDWYLRGGYYELPYHGIFWNKQAGRVWARGPGHLARPDMNLNNEIARATMIDAQFAAEPVILTRDEALSAADIHPNAILNGQMNDQGRPTFAYAQRGDNALRAEDKKRQVAEAIREAFKFSLYAVVNRPQMTATEFLGWDQEKFRRLAPHLVRVHMGLASFVARRWRILARAGQTAPPPPELAGQPIAIEFVSPLAKAQKAATGRAVLQWIGALGEIAAMKQDPGVMDVVNTDGASRVLHDAMVGLPDVINDQRQVQAIREQRAQAQQMQTGVANAAELAKVYAEVAHANQAQTKADQRGGERKGA